MTGWSLLGQGDLGSDLRGGGGLEHDGLTEKWGRERSGQRLHRSLGSIDGSAVVGRLGEGRACILAVHRRGDGPPAADEVFHSGLQRSFDLPRTVPLLAEAGRGGVGALFVDALVPVRGFLQHAPVDPHGSTERHDLLNLVDRVVGLGGVEVARGRVLGRQRALGLVQIRPDLEADLLLDLRLVRVLSRPLRLDQDEHRGHQEAGQQREGVAIPLHYSFLSDFKVSLYCYLVIAKI